MKILSPLLIQNEKAAPAADVTCYNRAIFWQPGGLRYNSHAAGRSAQLPQRAHDDASICNQRVQIRVKPDPAVPHFREPRGALLAQAEHTRRDARALAGREDFCIESVHLGAGQHAWEVIIRIHVQAVRETQVGGAWGFVSWVRVVGRLDAAGLEFERGAREGARAHRGQGCPKCAPGVP